MREFYKPALQQLLTQGEVGLHKLERVAPIATVENEKDLAEKVKLLSKKALEILTRDEKQNGFHKPLLLAGDPPGRILNFNLSEEVIEKLNGLHAQGQDANQLILKMLQERQEKIRQQKQELAEALQPTPSRYIPVAVKKVLKEEYGNKCSIQTCKRPAAEIHHSQRFSISRTHNPHYLAPMCKEHHQIAHAIDVKVQEIKNGVRIGRIHSP